MTFPLLGSRSTRARKTTGQESLSRRRQLLPEALEPRLMMAVLDSTTENIPILSLSTPTPAVISVQDVTAMQPAVTVYSAALDGLQGAPTQGTPTQGTPTQGTPTQGAPTQGAPTQGAPTQGAPTQGAPTQGAPTQGAPTQGAPRANELLDAVQASGDPPPVPVPGSLPEARWKWCPDPQNVRGGAWRPMSPVPGRSPPSASWDPAAGGGQPHWDVDDGLGNRQRYDKEGRPITAQDAHDTPDSNVKYLWIPIIGIGGYGTYRVVRMLPSLLPPFWGTVPLNLAIP
jgi:hypothetical protein